MADIHVYTAIFAGFDSLKPVPFNSSVRYTCVSDDPNTSHRHPWLINVVPRRLPDPRRENRWHKTHPPGGDWTIYLDAHLRLLHDPERVTELCERMNPDAKMFLVAHPSRRCLYAEAETVKRVRYDLPAVVDSQVAAYREARFPENAGLYCGGFLIRRRGCDEFNERWWQEIRNGSKRDQISLPFVLRETGLPFAVLPGKLTDYVDWGRHGRPR